MAKKKDKKLWGGRFTKDLDVRAKAFSYSLSVDGELLPYDIATNKAHVETLKKARLIKANEAQRLLKGLAAVEKTLAGRDLSVLSAQVEDVHTLIQTELEKKVGVIAKKLHTARSRNDQVTTSTRLYIKDKIKVLMRLITKYQKALLVFAEKGKAIALPGYTHLQRAQVVLFAHHILAYVEMAERDKGRLDGAFTRVDELPLGSGACAGLSFSLDRQYTAQILGFSRVSMNSMDAVSSRDYVIETLAAIATMYMHLSRLSEDCILWNSQEFGFIDIPEDFATGSSIMPHKKNPDMFELIRGKTGEAYGNLVSALVMMKGLPLTYNRDMQEDKKALFSSMTLAIQALEVLVPLIGKITIRKNRCLIASSDSLLYATDLMDYLITKGIDHQTAHATVGKIVMHALQSRKDLSTWSMQDFKKYSPTMGKDVVSIFTSEASLAKRKTAGSTNSVQVKKLLDLWRRRLR